MSKQVKDLITRELTARFKDLDGVAVINPRGISAIKNNHASAAASTRRACG